MAEGSFNFKLYSGRGLELEARASSVLVPSVVGQLGFLPNHCDYVGLLSTGVVEITDPATGSLRVCVVTGGVCTFKDNTLTLLADLVDHPDSVDRATYAEERELLESKRSTIPMMDPEWEIVDQRLGRIQALDTMFAAQGRPATH